MDKDGREILLEMTRRQFFGRTAKGIGVAALASLLGPGLMAEGPTVDPKTGGLVGMPNFAPKAKRVIFLHQSGAPSQIELFDYKPKLKNLQGTELPDSIRKGQRITGMTSGQASFPVAAPIFKFQQAGKSGTWISELLPHTAKIVDDIAIIKTVNTDAINHDPAITFIQTGFQQPGRPSMGAWVTYGLGSENQNLPAFVVLISQANALNPDQPLFSRLWGNGFLSSKYQGVRFRAGAEPVLYLDDPPGISRESRRHMLDSLAKLNKMWFDAYGDPEIETRITQYEMAYRMQTSVPDLMDLSKEPDSRVRDVRAGLAQARHLRCQLPARAAAGRAQRALHPALPPRLGPAQRSSPRHRAASQGHRSTLGGTGSGLEAARPARRHAGGLGRRIRPYCLLPGQAERDQLRSRSSSEMLRDVDGGRRYQARHLDR